MTVDYGNQFVYSVSTDIIEILRFAVGKFTFVPDPSGMFLHILELLMARTLVVEVVDLSLQILCYLHALEYAMVHKMGQSSPHHTVLLILMSFEAKPLNQSL